MQDTCNVQETYPREGIDSKAFLICLLKRIPYMLLIGLTGAIIGSGLYLLIAAVNNQTPEYFQETEYYIDFAQGRLEAKDYYNAFTWNDVIGTDLIMDKTMEILGENYERETVKNMITADILSDVRYLTITVKDLDPDVVSAVSEATCESLTSFGISKDEFDSITKIEDNGVELSQQPLFTWRAAFLGFVIAFLIIFFIFCVRFGVGECFYTKEQIRKVFRIPTLGMLYQQQNQPNGEQELQTCLALQPMITTGAVFVDVTKGDYAKNFVQAYASLAENSTEALPQIVSYPIDSTETYQRLESAEAVILVVPFGIPCQKRAQDVLCELRRRNCNIAGAVLAQADHKWVRVYYAGRK